MDTGGIRAFGVLIQRLTTYSRQMGVSVNGGTADSNTLRQKKLDSQAKLLKSLRDFWADSVWSLYVSSIVDWV
jgi:hypothetical protein